MIVPLALFRKEAKMKYDVYTYEDQDYILVKDLADDWYPNCTAKNQTTPVRKRLEANGITTDQITVQIKRSGRPLRITCWAILVSELEKAEKLSPRNPTISTPEADEEAKYGCAFYIIQKYPEDAPGIIKMGKTAKTAEARSKKFYVWRPTILREFPISSNDEKTLIKMIGKGCKQLGDEEFFVTDFDSLLRRADDCAAMLAMTEEEEQ